MSKKIKYAGKVWTSHYDEGVPATLTCKNICLPEILEKTVSEFPDKMALTFEGYKITFKELKNMVDE